MVGGEFFEPYTGEEQMSWTLDGCDPVVVAAVDAPDGAAAGVGVAAGMHAVDDSVDLEDVDNDVEPSQQKSEDRPAPSGGFAAMFGMAKKSLSNLNKSMDGGSPEDGDAVDPQDADSGDYGGTTMIIPSDRRDDTLLSSAAGDSAEVC